VHDAPILFERSQAPIVAGIEHERQSTMRGFYFALLMVAAAIPAAGCESAHAGEGLFLPQHAAAEQSRCLLTPLNRLTSWSSKRFTSFHAVPISSAADILAINVLARFPTPLLERSPCNLAASSTSACLWRSR
jgi:hypothetical protein